MAFYSLPVDKVGQRCTAVDRANGDNRCSISQPIEMTAACWASVVFDVRRMLGVVGGGRYGNFRVVYLNILQAM